MQGGAFSVGTVIEAGEEEDQVAEGNKVEDGDKALRCDDDGIDKQEVAAT